MGSTEKDKIFICTKKSCDDTKHMALLCHYVTVIVVIVLRY